MYEFLALDPERGFWDAAALVHLATLGYVLGFVLKNQIGLRILVLIATFAYIGYYYFHPAEPLWGAIYGSLLILAANIIGLIRILHGRVKFAMPDEQLMIFDAMSGLKPGEFRKLMRIGEVKRAEGDVTLTEEGRHPEYLFFVTEGSPRATKGGREFGIPIRHFIGEISFVLGSTATATVTLADGGHYVQWERGKLRRALANSEDFKIAFEALLSRDMAAKVANSIQIERAHPERMLRDAEPEPDLSAIVATA
ncbi:MAG: hypothetical protein AAFP78_01350 [Pseudomonadota bacterium]